MSDFRFLVVIETQRVKGYLFASPILRETRGASLLLDQLNRRKTKDLLQKIPGQIVYLGGGSGRVLFDSEERAKDFKRAVLACYREETGTARVSVEVVPRDDGESFPAWVSRGVEESQKSKLARAEVIASLGGRWIRPCTSCGREPAEEIPPPDIQRKDHRLCRSCHAKRKQIADFYRKSKGNLDRLRPMPLAGELREQWPDYVLTTLAEAVEKDHPGLRTLLPRDFQQIGARSRPRNYFGLIYADGNRMGETIRAMAVVFPEDEEARQAYGAFSQIVDQATREAAVEAVLGEVETPELESDDGPARLVPAELVIAGGDDLILIVPAHAALGVAERFIRGFQAKTRALQEEAVGKGEIPRPFAKDGLTTSAGVVISHASYPASQLVDLAAELMKSAKRKDAASSAPEGTLDFLVLHESGTETLKQRWKEYKGKLFDGRAVWRTERPYTVGDMTKFRERVLALKKSGAPRGKLKALYAALFRSHVEAQYEAARIRERLKVTGDLKAPGPLAGLMEELPLFPFRETNGAWSTPLSELIEAYDFLHPKEESVPAVDAEEILAGS